ncbi:S8 family serine peptidase [Streptomyces sp. SCSIO ZS0520]|uniref:S8 family serine peptidase n=1 Tax=Streptomyces sp. SCSIO ZS0520 TaxID=2892996 RepID=UPI0021D9893D|nr:S8 family serine peptidase [Streptomyces sp. SCSIO ZS0520]
MSAEKIWKVSTGRGVKVAVIDTGVNANTSSLKGQVLTDEVPKKVSYHATGDYTGHGTTMAEVIAGTGAGGGLRGIAPGAKVVPYRVLLNGLEDKNEIKRTPEPSEALRAAADTDVKVINMSMGVYAATPDMKAAVQYAYSKGKLMFAAVGNTAKEKNLIGYPAAFRGVVGVSALDQNGKVGEFSQHGDYIDLSAPGLDLPRWCDSTFESYCGKSQGTSFSAAYASASAALIWSAHPDWTSHQVLRVLIDTAGRDWPKDERSNYLGYGVVRPARNLLRHEGDPGPADVDPITGRTVAMPAGGGQGEAAEPESSSAPSASGSESSQASGNTSGKASEDKPSAAGSSDDRTGLWIALGSVAALAVLGGGGVAVVRSRRGH